MLREEIDQLLLLHNGRNIGGNIIHYGGTTAAISAKTAGPGVYTCVVILRDGHTHQASLEITEGTPPPPTVTPPTSLEAAWVVGEGGSLHDVLVTWGQPEMSDGVRGYKINWDLPGL